MSQQTCHCTTVTSATYSYSDHAHDKSSTRQYKLHIQQPHSAHVSWHCMVVLPRPPPQPPINIQQCYCRQYPWALTPKQSHIIIFQLFKKTSLPLAVWATPMHAGPDQYTVDVCKTSTLSHKPCLLKQPLYYVEHACPAMQGLPWQTATRCNLYSSIYYYNYGAIQQYQWSWQTQHATW